MAPKVTFASDSKSPDWGMWDQIPLISSTSYCWLHLPTDASHHSEVEFQKWHKINPRGTSL